MNKLILFFFFFWEVLIYLLVILILKVNLLLITVSIQHTGISSLGIGLFLIIYIVNFKRKL